MHDTAAAFGAAFFRCYADGIAGARILEVGAGDVNGSLRGCAPHDSRYTGIDLAAGPGVDVVLSDPYSYPFKPATYDIVVSSSCFEHDQMFWLSFTEMCRVLRSGGFIYLNVPSNGTFHRYPADNWRFYPDAGLALVAWGHRNGHDIHLVESFIGRRRRDVWNDCVMVFGKGDTPRQLSLLAELFPRSLNIRVGEQEIISNYCEQTEDMTLQAWLTEKLRSSPTPSGNGSETTVETLLMSLAEREVALGTAERAAAERSAAAETARDAALAELDQKAAGLAAAAAGLQRAEADLHSELAERDVALAAAAAGLQRAEAETAHLRGALSDAAQRVEAELSAIRAALAEREAGLARAEVDAADLRTALAEREAALGTTARAAAERGTQIAGLRAELDQYQAQHAEAVRERDEQAAALAAVRAELEATQSARATVRTALVLAEKKNAAIDGLRRSVASLEHEAEERTAATVSLRDELTAARQVSRALLAALRTGPVLASPTDQPVRQPRGIFRLIWHWTGRARG